MFFSCGRFAVCDSVHTSVMGFSCALEMRRLGKSGYAFFPIFSPGLEKGQKSCTMCCCGYSGELCLCALICKYIQVEHI